MSSGFGNNSRYWRNHEGIKKDKKEACKNRQVQDCCMRLGDKGAINGNDCCVHLAHTLLLTTPMSDHGSATASHSKLSAAIESTVDQMRFVVGMTSQRRCLPWKRESNGHANHVCRSTMVRIWQHSVPLSLSRLVQRYGMYKPAKHVINVIKITIWHQVTAWAASFPADMQWFCHWAACKVLPANNRQRNRKQVMRHHDEK